MKLINLDYLNILKQLLQIEVSKNTSIYTFLIYAFSTNFAEYTFYWLFLPIMLFLAVYMFRKGFSFVVSLGSLWLLLGYFIFSLSMFFLMKNSFSSLTDALYNQSIDAARAFFFAIFIGFYVRKYRGLLIFSWFVMIYNP